MRRHGFVLLLVSDTRGKINAFHVHTAHTTVLQFKRVLRSRVAIPIRHMQLIFEGQRLANDRMLSSYDLSDGAWFNAVFDDSGGGGNDDCDARAAASE